ncbi:hypothetical protein BY457_12326 [Marinilabilia salmonicolor]|jgi:hypothetical protein|uniref:hypothetical protein n=1 Tax=Marinilabilia salmonicolor TaxID=989 RepID=UPI000D0746DF|nr:hypothetical protein [Marinilabilia salmonicolor]PRY91882.1 hypothetical protein BY457_12326 [Marinilabilia salmonicolor]
MDDITLLFVFAVIIPFGYFISRRKMPLIVRSKAVEILEDIVFPKGHQQKQEIVNTFHDITNHRFKDEEVLDYYFKMKGLCILGRNCHLNFWVKNYLLSPSLIKLNYFEQLRFFETFLRCS